MARWSVEFESDTANESICLLNAQFDSGTTTIYSALQGKQHASDAVETRENLPMPTAGLFKKLYVKLSTDPGTAPDAFTLALRVNGATKNNTVTIVADNTTGNDVAHTDAVVAADLVAFIIIPVSSPSASPYAAIGIVFCPTVDGESLLFGGSSFASVDSVDTEYLPLCELNALDWSATEQFSLIQACIVKNLYVKLDTAPSSGDSYDISINKDGGVASGLTVNIAGAATSGNDTAHTYVAGNGDTISLKSVPTSAPDNGMVRIGCVLYNEPAITKRSVPRIARIMLLSP
jgi:hypothetical protein